MDVSRKLHFDKSKRRKTLNVCATSNEIEIFRENCCSRHHCRDVH